MKIRTSELIKHYLSNCPSPESITPTQLSCALFLMDWQLSLKYNKTLTDISWLYTSSGPVIDNLHCLAESDMGIVVRSDAGDLSDTICRLNKSVATAKNTYLTIHPVISPIAIRCSKMSEAALHQLVICTYPFICNRPGAILDLKELAKTYNRLVHESQNSGLIAAKAS